MRRLTKNEECEIEWKCDFTLRIARLFMEGLFRGTNDGFVMNTKSPIKNNTNKGKQNESK